MRRDLEATLSAIALTAAEYDLIVHRLGREPNHVELGMFSAMWSEHCGYKNSKPLFSHFPTDSERVTVKIGEENAGAVDIGDGQSIVFKMESHNHPSAVEPYQGAATGIGGIVRDIFTMGARPFALLNSLRFGPLDDEHNRFLLNGVVAGISGYGNCLGIPNVGGELVFDPSYSGNPLVNAMCVGLLEPGMLVRARASGVGNLIMVVGAPTGRDGIHGATFASLGLTDESSLRRPAVQVGNPFMEKLLMEACLELAAEGLVVGMQDLGAAGLTSSTVECADKGSGGAEIDLAMAPRRESGMNAYEMMLSESQERMLVIVEPKNEAAVRAVFDKWDLSAATIGRVTDDGLVRVKEGAETVAQIPTSILVDPPLYTREGIRPAYLDETSNYDFALIPEPVDLNDVLLKLLASPNIASKHEVFRRYDHQVMNNTTVPPGHDAAVLRIKGTTKAIALAIDCDGRSVYLDPWTGGASAVAEAARNLSCVGAEPLAVTDCLNYGNPENPEIYYQLEQSIKGISAACRALNTPVISGNASMYNESAGGAIYPTPTIGMVGLIDHVTQIVTTAFVSEGDFIGLIGPTVAGPASLAASEYAAMIHEVVAGSPKIDLALERAIQQLCRDLVRSGIARSAHDCSRGGIAVALARCCIAGERGAMLRLPDGGRSDARLFGELQSRIVVSTSPDRWVEAEELARSNAVPFERLGTVTGRRFSIEGLIDVPMTLLSNAWRTGLDL